MNKPILNLQRDVDSFTAGYIEAALWSSIDNNGDSFDRNYNWTALTDLAEKTLETMIAECKRFQSATGVTSKQGGHDFWLTRNHHGSGFWDGDWPNGEELTKVAHSFGECSLYIGDDGKIYS